jgi:hypothetical protein
VKIKFIVHKNVTKIELEEIIQIKTIAWPYSFEKQLKWIKNNIKESDVHVLLYDIQGEIIAYANLINIGVKINHLDFSAFGIGNVCTKEKGKGYGKVLMNFINHYLLQKNKIGLLFCTPKLIHFYELNQWELIAKNKIHLPSNYAFVKSMMFNWNHDLESIEYRGLAF